MTQVKTATEPVQLDPLLADLFREPSMDVTERLEALFEYVEPAKQAEIAAKLLAYLSQKEEMTVDQSSLSMLAFLGKRDGNEEQERDFVREVFSCIRTRLTLRRHVLMQTLTANQAIKNANHLLHDINQELKLRHELLPDAIRNGNAGFIEAFVCEALSHGFVVFAEQLLRAFGWAYLQGMPSQAPSTSLVDDTRVMDELRRLARGSMFLAERDGRQGIVAALAIFGRCEGQMTTVPSMVGQPIALNLLDASREDRYGRPCEQGASDDKQNTALLRARRWIREDGKTYKRLYSLYRGERLLPIILYTRQDAGSYHWVQLQGQNAPIDHLVINLLSLGQWQTAFEVVQETFGTELYDEHHPRVRIDTRPRGRLKSRDACREILLFAVAGMLLAKLEGRTCTAAALGQLLLFELKNGNRDPIHCIAESRAVEQLNELTAQAKIDTTAGDVALQRKREANALLERCKLPHTRDDEVRKLATENIARITRIAEELLTELAETEQNPYVVTWFHND